MNGRIRLLAVAAIAAGIAAFLKRPVKPPATQGSWHPADQEKSKR